MAIMNKLSQRTFVNTDGELKIAQGEILQLQFMWLNKKRLQKRTPTRRGKEHASGICDLEQVVMNSKEETV